MERLLYNLPIVQNLSIIHNIYEKHKNLSYVNLSQNILSSCREFEMRIMAPAVSF